MEMEVDIFPGLNLFATSDVFAEYFESKISNIVYNVEFEEEYMARALNFYLALIGRKLEMII